MNINEKREKRRLIGAIGSPLTLIVGSLPHNFCSKIVGTQGKQFIAEKE
jgi:hypothetical protein